MNCKRILISNKNENDEVFILKFDDSDNKFAIIYAPLRSYLTKISMVYAEKLLNKEEEYTNKLAEILHNCQKINIDDIHELSHSALPSLTISVTDKCNLRCKYCFFSAGTPNKNLTMPKSMIKDIIDAYFLVLKEKIDSSYVNKDKTILISFAGGGEQTCAFEELKFAIDYINKKAKELSLVAKFEMPTNGVYNNEIREYVVRNFSSVSLSFDGYEAIQNFHRPKSNGQGTYNDVLTTARYFYDHKIDFAVRITVSNLSLDHLEEIVEFFRNQFPGIKIGIEPLTILGRAEKHIDGLGEPDNRLYAKKLSKIYKASESENFSVKNSAIAKLGMPRTVFCSNISNPNWVVATDGKIYACAHTTPQTQFGHYDKDSKKIIIDGNRIEYVKSLNVLNYESCKDCFCKYTCAGDCADRHIRGQFRCDVNRKVTADLLLKVLNIEGAI